MGEVRWALGNGRLWPLILANISLAFVLAPFFNRHRRGLGGLFIPGIPMMMVSSMLLIASITNWWGLWEYLWPMIIIASAFGFVAAAAWMRNVWLLIPATIIGVNGFVFQFCMVTGMWEIWAAIWPVELLAVGASLLLVNLWEGSEGLFTAGIILSGLAGLGFALMGLILSGWVSLFAALILVGAGVALIGRNAAPALASDADKKMPEMFTKEDITQLKEAV